MEDLEVKEDKEDREEEEVNNHMVIDPLLKIKITLEE
eukprot:CAMPEP_0204821148 /NCGR_PEP_ID=MMETSP1018-20131115/4066_1 /ASSEMBLY_ACC=CAM_ASM_000518 /TAXON_ID=46462 /ORGANISM="Anophryoides haemophila, Strain AH6" /LENGTH=36 /DNA_ID= /DNA_START= /DNA_END= /DNA_ORIENTATION=